MPPGRASASWVQAWTTLAAVGLLMALPQWARAETCLPSLAEEGRRLSEMPEPSTFWLELLLRQHEACRVAKGPHEDVRVFVYGSTPVMGYPGPAAESVTEQLNFFWRQQGLRAHAFNFAFGAGHATKDMLIVRESLRYRPDVIVYGMTPADLTRGLAARYRPSAPLPLLRLVRFMRSSAPSVLEFAAENPAGLRRPLEGYEREFAGLDRSWARPWTWPMREIVAYVYTVVATRLRRVAEQLGLLDPAGLTLPEASPYRCEATRRQNLRDYGQWGAVDPLEYLAELRARMGIPIVLVVWPISSESSGDCFNRYYTAATVQGFRTWTRAEAERLGLPLVDLSYILLVRDFLDGLHANARGNRKTAGALSAQLVPVLRTRIAEVLPPH